MTTGQQGQIDPSVLKRRLRNTLEVAHHLGLSPRRIRALATERGLGFKLGGRMFFTAQDVREMRVRRPGTPGHKENR
jgi:hypothetical protein